MKSDVFMLPKGGSKDYLLLYSGQKKFWVFSQGLKLCEKHPFCPPIFENMEMNFLEEKVGMAGFLKQGVSALEKVGEGAE